MKPKMFRAQPRVIVALMGLLPLGAMAQLTLDLSTPTTTTHGTVTLDFTLDPAGSVSVVASASNSNTDVTEMNRTLGGAIPPGLTGSFSMTLRATSGSGAGGNVRSSADGCGVQGQNAQRIDWADLNGQVSEVLIVEVDLADADGVDGIEFLGFTKDNANLSRLGVVDLEGGSAVERASGNATETIMFSDGPSGNFSIGSGESGSISFEQLDKNNGGSAIGELIFELDLGGMIAFGADKTDVSDTESVLLSWTVPNPPGNGSYQIASDNPGFNGGVPLDVTANTINGVGSVSLLLDRTQTLTLVENTPATVEPITITSRTGPGVPNVSQTAGTILAEWTTSTDHSDRNLLAGIHRGYLWIQSRPDDGGRNLLMVYDVSDPANPVEVHRRDLPSTGGVRPEHMAFMYDEDNFLMPVNSQLFHDMSNMLDIQMVDDAPFNISRAGDAAAEYVQLPLQFNGQYGYSSGATPLAIRNILTDTLLSDAVDPQSDFGFKGHPLVIGNLLLAVGSRDTPGVATYDVSDPTDPILLDVITSDLDALDTGDNFVNEGAYEPSVWGSYVVYGNQDRNLPQIKVVDFSDPSNLRLVAHITDSSLEAARYQQFQDEYLFTGNAKIDMRDFTIVRQLKPSDITNQISEYVLPVGNLVAIGEHQGTDGGKAYLIAHQDEPDDRAPFVTYHNPLANSLNMHLSSRIGIVIPETLNPLTIHSDHLVVRPFGGSPIDGTITYTDKDIISFVPDDPLAPDTTYEVVLPAGGIEDVSGNAVSEFGFAFSTGSSLAPSPYTGLFNTYGNGGQPGSGDAWALLNPGAVRIEAENFNQGGEGVAYHDRDGVNEGGGYRPAEGVDISTTSDTGGGFVVDGTAAGEWLEYTVEVPVSGLYDLSLRVSNDSGSDSELSLLFGASSEELVDATGPIVIPNSAFVTSVVEGISLNEGRQVMRIRIDQPGVELNWIEFEGVGTLVPSILHYDFEGDVLDQSPSGFDGTMQNFPASPFVAESAVNSEALNFDGTDDYVAIQDLVYDDTTLPAVSVSCWIRTNDGSDQIIASFDRNAYWRLGIGDDGVGEGLIGWHVMTDSGQQDFPSVSRIDDGKWHHVVTTFDGEEEELRIYIDGALDATLPNAGTVFGSSETRFGFLGVGSEASGFDGSTGPALFLNGSLDDFHLFHDVLDQEQIEYLFLQRNTPNSTPQITAIDVSQYPASVDSPVTITTTASDPENDPLEYRINPGDGSGFSEWQSSSSFELTFSSDGHYGISVQVRDLFQAQSVATSAVTVMNSPPSGPTPSRNSPIAEIGGDRVMVVNPDNHSVTSINTSTLSHEFEVPVGADPRAAATAGTGEIWVTCHDADRLDVLSPVDGSLLASISLDYGAEPYGVTFSPDGSIGYVTLQGRGELLEIDPVSRSITGTLALGPKPRALAVSPDGGRVLVTRFMSPQTHGEVYDVDASSLTLTRVIQLAKDTTPDHANGGRGVPNYLMGIAITPDGSKAWVSSQKANIDRGMFREGQALSHENTVRAILSCIDLGTNSEELSKRIDIDNSNMPIGITFSPLGDYAFVALQANNFVLDVDLLGGGSPGIRWPSGLAPQGVAYLHGSDRLVAKNFMDRSVSIYDASDFVREGKGLVSLATIPTVTTERLSGDVLRGKQIFYDAEDPRMALDGYQTCASCHQDGGTDNRVWDFTDRGEGLRNTTDLRARRGTGHGFVHWSANFDEIQDFEHDIRGAFLGEGFLTEEEFNFDTRNTTLGEPKTGVDADLDALAAYVTSLDSVGRSPHRTPDGDLTSEALAGRILFAQLDCMSCHAGDSLTDSNTLPTLHDVGTLKVGSGDRLGGTLQGIDTPTLRGLWRTAPYLHDGSAATLQEVLTTQNPGDLHGVTSGLSPTEVDHLVAYLLQIDECEGSINPEANSGFVLIDDFEDYNLGSDLLGQGAWNTSETRAPATSATVVFDPAALSGQVMELVEISDAGNQAAIDQSTLEIEDGSTATVFFRMRHTALSGDPDTPMGVGANDNGIHGSIDLQMKFRAGGEENQIKTSGGVPDALDIDRDVWFNVWWVITNGADGGAETLECYLQSDDDPDYQDIQWVTTVTNDPGSSDPIIDTLAFTKFNDNGEMLIDDIYYDDRGINLKDPTGRYLDESGIANATMASSQQIDLSWTDETGAGMYYIEVADSADGPWTPWKRLLGNPTSIAMDGLMPVSTYAFRISALSADGELISRDVVESTTQEPYDDWAQDFALAPAVYGKDADPDGDGVLNRFERAYGSSPLVADPSVRPTLEKVDGKWVLNYRYNSEATDLSLVPQLSEDLSAWDEGPLHLEDSLLGNEGSVELRQAEPIDGSMEKLFLRLRLDSQY